MPPYGVLGKFYLFSTIYNFYKKKETKQINEKPIKQVKRLHR